MGTGRNEPCPCGSGLKYKKCCLNKSVASLGEVVQFPGVFPSTVPGSSAQGFSNELDRVPTHPNPAAAINAEIRSLLEEHDFDSIEQAQAFLDQHMEQRNNKGLPEFHGLSPTQMKMMLGASTEIAPLISLPETIEVDESVPFILFFNDIYKAISDNGLKATQKGNLPRQFCRSVAMNYWGDKQYAHNTRFSNINSETDFTELHVFRITCEMAGFIRKYKGKFILSSKCQKVLEKEGVAAVYRGLFHTFTNEFNWSFTDRYPELDFIQTSWAFTLYLLQQHGAQWRSADFYADAFLQAFPAIVETIPEEPYGTREEWIKRCYHHRVISHWMTWLGLAEVEDLDPKSILRDNLRLRKTSLADEVIVFKV